MTENKEQRSILIDVFSPKLTHRKISHQAKLSSATYHSHSRLLQIPQLKSLLHVGISEQSETNIALDRPIHNALHVRALHHLHRRNLNLMSEPRRQSSHHTPRDPAAP